MYGKQIGRTDGLTQWLLRAKFKYQVFKIVLLLITSICIFFQFNLIFVSLWSLLRFTFTQKLMFVVLHNSQSGRVVKAYEYYQTCIATKTFEFLGFLSEARNDTPNLTACCTNVPNLILLKIGHLCSSFVQVSHSV